VEDGDRLRQRQGQVEEQRALPGLPDGLQPQFPLALGGRVRLGVQQAGVDVRGLPAAAWRPAQPRSVGGFPLAEQKVIWPALDQLTRLEAKRLRAGAPPAAGRLAAHLAGLDVVVRRVLAETLVDLPPDVVKVVALAQGRDNRQPAYQRPAGATGLTMIIRWCMGVMRFLIMDQSSQSKQSRSFIGNCAKKREGHRRAGILDRLENQDLTVTTSSRSPPTRLGQVRAEQLMRWNDAQATDQRG
jgi:hypothetical protein